MTAAVAIVAPFAWRRPKHGYRWLQARALEYHPRRTTFRADGRIDDWPPKTDDVRVLVRADFEEREYELEPTDPLGDPRVLHRAFAELIPTEERVAAFANSWGSLGVPEWVELDGGRSSRPIRIVGEQLLDWRLAIARVRTATELFDAILDHNLAALRFALNDARLAVVAGDPPTGARTWSEPQVNAFSDERLLQEARALLRGHVDGALGQSCRLRLLQDPESGQDRLAVEPDSLLGAIWLQLGQAIDGQRRFRQCAGPSCRVWFELAVEKGAREDRRYHADACRSAALRRRQKQTTLALAG
jgi:hypothetical protein